MKKEYPRNFYLHTLYMNAGRNINEKVFRTAANSINYECFDYEYNSLSINTQNQQLYIDDPYSAFFHSLCRKISYKIYSNDFIIYTMSPYYHSDVICQLLIPEKNCFFCNSSALRISKVSKLYISSNADKLYDLHAISYDFFEKSIKKQQESV